MYATCCGDIRKAGKPRSNCDSSGVGPAVMTLCRKVSNGQQKKGEECIRAAAFSDDCKKLLVKQL